MLEQGPPSAGACDGARLPSDRRRDGTATRGRCRDVCGISLQRPWAGLTMRILRGAGRVQEGSFLPLRALCRSGKLRAIAAWMGNRL